MTNISQQKRQKMLEFLKKLKEEHNDDDSLIAIGEIETALNEKKYGLVWEKHTEKVDEMLEHNIPIFYEEKQRKIVADENNEFNFLLEGDNLHSLKLLEKTHKGKIDVIYIDPPYNTGNKDFIYNDSFVDKKDGYSHSKWLSFMSERLEIARELLSDEGVIFISIDDNEQAQLKLLCDDVFGEENFIANYKWNKTSTPPSLSKKVRTKFEYVLCYEKYKTGIEYNGGITIGGDMPLLNEGNAIRQIKFDKSKIKFSFDGKFQQGKYEKVKLIDDIDIVDGFSIKDFVLEGSFKWTQETLDEEILNGTTFVIKSKKFSPRYIRKGERIKRPSDIISMTECFVETNEGAKKELNIILPNNTMSYPKPVSLIKYLIKFTENNRFNNTVLDFFAGSGTTGHAVMQLNKEDGGNRKYILCTNNENNICEEVTYQRLKNIQEDLPHNLKYFKTDFISKYESDEEEETISEKMLKHIKELIELEYHIELDNKKHIILTDEEMLNDVVENIEKDGKLFITSVIFLSRTHQRILDDKNVLVIDIPEYYYRNELKEIGEI